ncbi:MAG: cold shock domain-containing protein [Pseudomonadota bacterium]
MTTVTGHIKWFDTGKGFGFVVADEGGPDILIHANVLYDFGVSSALEGSVITCEVTETERGRQVVDILELDAPIVDPIEVLGDVLPNGVDASELLKTAPLTPARVKWFDKSKGFGFVNTFGSADDIFVHVEVMRAYGFGELDRGEALAVKYTAGTRGLIVIEIKPWEEAIERI